MISFTIPGDPVGKGRARFAKRGKFMQSYTPEKTVNYEALVKMCAAQAYRGPPLAGPIAMHIRAYFAIPKTMTKAKRVLADADALYCVKKPDGDNVIKIISDAMNKIIYVDDAQICDESCAKRYSPNPRVEVSLYEITSP